MRFQDIVPEIIALLLLTLVYFGIGVEGFHRRHLKIE